MFSTAGAGARDLGLVLDIQKSAIVEYDIVALSANELAVQWDLDFTDIGVPLTANQTAFGGHFNAATATTDDSEERADIRDLVALLFNLQDEALVPPIYDSLNGEIYAAQRGQAIGAQMRFAQSIGRCMVPGSERACLTARAFNSGETRRGEPGIQDQSSASNGIQVDAAFPFDGGYLGFGLQLGDITTTQISTKAEAKSRFEAVGVNWTWLPDDRWRLRAGLSLLRDSAKVTRYPVLGAPVSGTYRSFVIGPHVEAEAVFALGGGAYLRPSLRVDAGIASSKAMREQGSGLGLAMQRSQDFYAALTPAIEVGFSRPCGSNACHAISGMFKVGGTVQLGGGDATATGGFAATPNATPFTVTDPLGSGWHVEAGVSVHLSERLAISLTGRHDRRGATRRNQIALMFETQM